MEACLQMSFELVIQRKEGHIKCFVENILLLFQSSLFEVSDISVRIPF